MKDQCRVANWNSGRLVPVPDKNIMSFRILASLVLVIVVDINSFKFSVFFQNRFNQNLR